jgi:hypothetical protein
MANRKKWRRMACQWQHLANGGWPAAYNHRRISIDNEKYQLSAMAKA